MADQIEKVDTQLAQDHWTLPFLNSSYVFGVGRFLARRLIMIIIVIMTISTFMHVDLTLQCE